jgi:hypothetical protein
MPTIGAVGPPCRRGGLADFIEPCLPTVGRTVPTGTGWAKVTSCKTGEVERLANSSQTTPGATDRQVNARPVSSFPKQAIAVIHGMGEQMPMDTIKSFVRAVWETDPEITAKDLPNPAAVWSKPDLRTGSCELRRITTRESRHSDMFPRGVRSDFYELYWADLSGGSTWSQVQD